MQSEHAFVHLHAHSFYSILTALPSPEALVSYAHKLGFPALALTDTSVMYGAIEFYQKAHAVGIKPILGMELFVVDSTQDTHARKPFPLVLLAKDYVGYKYLLYLSSHAHLEGVRDGVPCIDKKILHRQHNQLIALTGGVQGEIASALARHNETQAKQLLHEYQNIFGKENVYIELQSRLEVPEANALFQQLYAFSRTMSVPLVATNDVHYLKPEDAHAQDILQCIKAKKLYRDESRTSLQQSNYALLSAHEMAERFSELPEALKNTLKITEQCNVQLPLGSIQLPSFPLPDRMTPEERLVQLCDDGILRRYRQKSPAIEQRLAYELSIIRKTGFASYFLIVQDFINWAKQNNIVVGPGRGSAAGSLVAYLTNITNIDPLQYDLLFERFLNPERVSMPDIDTDFDDERRDDVIAYVEEKYGKDRVAQIITFGTMAARAAVRDVGRVLGFAYNFCDRIAKLIPTFRTIDEAFTEVPELKNLYETDPDCERLIKTARKLEGVVRHTSIHACGVVITKDPLVEHTALQHAENGSVISQYALHSVEDLGLLKMDFLGLKNLTIIRNTLDIVQKTVGEQIDIDVIPLDDSRTYRLLQQGQTIGVFQLESSGMRRYLRELEPTEFEDIIAMVALYRPGPMEFIPDYIAGKHGRKAIEYLHNELKPLLQKTYGIAVYQEQIMEIARQLAGFTYGEADVLRKAVGKKIKELLATQETKMIQGMIHHGIAPQTAKKIWEFILPFARYGFNRSHAACYALISYQTAYLKANYPAQFMAALMTADAGDSDRIAIEVQECRQLGIEVLPPDINESFSTFTVVRKSLNADKPRIRFGLAAIKNVGSTIVHAIIRERKSGGAFTDIAQFLSRVHHKDLNKKALESFIKSGALERFDGRAVFLHNLPQLLQYARNVALARTNRQGNLFGDFQLPLLPLDQGPTISRAQQLQWEKDLLGLYISAHPLSLYKDEIIHRAVLIESAKHFPDDTPVRLIGYVTKTKRLITKNREGMLFAQFEDFSGEIEAIVFPRIFRETHFLWSQGALLLVDGHMSHKDHLVKIIADTVREISLNDIATLPVWNPSSVLITLPYRVHQSVVTQLQKIFSEHPGQCSVRLCVEGGQLDKEILTKTRIHCDAATLTAIEHIVGSGKVRMNMSVRA
ncbi:MAG: DNA polymerase III subunit alpha [Candidatus Kerfeldbacteria bacterium RIFCSPHIGHO2_02_FULL_42_14]|uniref:DNA polymerase III subunit alpha n=1 Tax=Candidatus Kerfeldbacteria bacterium RIFCSPHIGHO2_02_FULL_42_14 TaxID=1798540 RepID=A0A1G2ASR3_9BACT|nr:MAG: DNA polymerase III subunit alpha [Candidatus Kerfeldbacteria bacterium RIFCSPHIGHO2_02_FULL_42_14]OGY80680.1 MAG: DNA polymerase III subunit alpha [Candidatus Kerfeldbacteria bacterium RIFCSPHIGHO2_12_FULL_42_13]OGY82607.1 MAG: DNA polymerase III subunit alpha [Candidatus Kerfeldbacteria bacterium RIFCSPLOWO2_02_FULL_42_19]